RSKSVVFDYAKNFENVETFVTQFSSFLGADQVKLLDRSSGSGDVLALSEEGSGKQSGTDPDQSSKSEGGV
ncbi:MAG TPA: hypothetical protein PK671_15735, partial [Candidatus Obscuribacter sp.]|nr:hypothetical protein [Candidatus Obscuribacter sp.]